MSGWQHAIDSKDLVNAPNQPLQLTAGHCGFMTVFGLWRGLVVGCVSATPATTELGALGIHGQSDVFNSGNGVFLATTLS